MYIWMYVWMDGKRVKEEDKNAAQTHATLLYLSPSPSLSLSPSQVWGLIGSAYRSAISDFCFLVNPSYA